MFIDRHRFPLKKMFFGAALIAVACVPPQGASSEAADQLNVLFIAVDDLNDWVGALHGHPQTRTPNIDRLAARGVLFTNAHAPAPACNPSRTAVLTGLYPTSTGVYQNDQGFRPVLPDAVTLPQYFMAHGYSTLGAGKIFHSRFPDPDSWNDYFPSQILNSPDDPVPANLPANGIHDIRLFDWGPLDVSDAEMGDTKVADWIIEQLQTRHQGPFFLASGFYRPHLPWFVPRAYFERHPLDTVRLPEILESDLDDVPDAGIAMVGRHYHQSVVEHDQWRQAVQGYLAAIEFADTQVGRVIDALDQSDYKDNTIVVLWSDHGWHLGEKSHWRKFALWERATRVTFLIVAPGVTTPGGRSARPVNLIDMYPTLADLAGLPRPSGVDGLSLRPLLDDPDASWERPSLTTHGRGNHAVRGERWRYIRYADGSEELYDHETDDPEWHNLAGGTIHADVKMQLSRWIPDVEAPDAPKADRE